MLSTGLSSAYVGMPRTNRKRRSCARNARKNMTGGALVSQYTVGDRIPGVANYAQEIKSFNDCGYKAPAISVSQSGLPGFSGVSGLKFWGGKRRTGRKTMKKRGGANTNQNTNKTVLNKAKNAFMGLFTQPAQATNAPAQATNVNMGPEPALENSPVPMPNMPANVVSTNEQAGGGGGMAYGTAFEMGGVNPLTIQTRLGCESGAGQVQAAQPSFFGKLFSGGRSAFAERRGKSSSRRMHGGSADYASAFDVMARQPSNLVLTSPYSGQGLVYEAPRVGFGVEASGSTGVPPFEIYKGYDASKALSGPCTQKGGKKSKKSKKAKKSKRTRKH
jgi:hypothetical protein